MRRCTLVLSLILTAAMATACSGDSSTTVLAPKPIPSEYQGLSMEQLKSKSSDIAYSDILGISSGDVITRSNTYDSKIAENIMKHEGSLVFFNGTIEIVYPSSEEGTFTLGFCSSPGSAKVSSEVASQCIDPVFLLYDLDRGPKLKKGDLVDVTGIIAGTRTRVSKQRQGSTIGSTARQSASITSKNIFVTPSISVIKAELLGQ